MNPEAVPYIFNVILFLCCVAGVTLVFFLGLWLGRNVFAKKPKPGAKPKTYIKEYTFTLEQTLELAKLWDAMGNGKRLASVMFWQTVRSMVPKEDNHEAMEMDVSGHSRWRAKITKDVVPELPPGNPELGQIAAHTAKQMMAEKTP